MSDQLKHNTPDCTGMWILNHHEAKGAPGQQPPQQMVLAVCEQCGARIVGEALTIAAGASKDAMTRLRPRLIEGSRVEAEGGERVPIHGGPMSENRAQYGERRPVTLCVQCGPGVTVDEDGCCIGCGALAFGEWANRALAALYPQPQPDQAALVERLESAASYLAGYADLVKIGGKTKWGDFPEDPEIRAAHYGSDKLLVVEARLREAARALSAPEEVAKKNYERGVRDGISRARSRPGFGDMGG